MQKNHLKILSLSLITSIFFISCSTKEEIINIDTVVEFNDLHNAPHWVITPFFENSLSANGKYFNNLDKFRTQRDRAIENSKKNLKNKIKSKISTIISTLKSSDFYEESTILNNKILNVTQKITVNIMKKVRVKKLWKSDKDVINILVAVELNIIKDEMERLISNSFPSNKAIYQNFIVLKSNGKLDIELRKTL